MIKAIVASIVLVLLVAITGGLYLYMVPKDQQSTHAQVAKSVPRKFVAWYRQSRAYLIQLFSAKPTEEAASTAA